MEVFESDIPGVLRIQPKVFGDARGFFVETFQAERYRELGVPGPFVQDNMSRSAPGILRGLHLQHPRGQGKLVSVLEGRVLDVAVDVRVGSPTFGQHVSEVLDAERKNQLWIPPGFAHGFCVLGDAPATFAYKCTELYAPENELSVLWSDPDLGIDWPLDAPKLSDKDAAAARLKDIPKDRLPSWESA
ncbi:MAG: dTDP-4-dehydrorhamnose 3,5-epimerase [Sandaracinaceae bacterium]|nr:MAG: dTDP-4-dehydrorhamnose 3,5-epimerase [Sandaracinaceae bacterium]